jgi:RNA polymerase sigma-70 factor (ECF subfamily)
MDELERWLADGYADAYRTACLILRNPADAEEAVQEAFLRAWRFRRALRDHGAARSWLYRILVNTCCSKLRRELTRRARLAGSAGLEALAWDGPGPEVASGTAELAGAVARAVSELPEHLRIPVVLRYYAGLSEREVAVAIRRRPGTVKSRLADARRRLSANPALVALVIDSGAEEVSR